MGKEVGPKKYVAAAPTFNTVSGETLKIKDLVPSGEGDFDGATFYVITWAANGSPMKAKNDPWIKANCPDLIDEYGNKDVHLSYDAETGKWWFGNDFDDKNWELTEYEIPAGVGYTYYASSDFEDGLTVTCSGAVATEDVPVEVGSREYIRSGNIAPKDIKVSDLLPEGEGDFDGSTFYVITWDTNGSPMKAKNDPWIKANCPDLIDEYGNKDVHLSYDATTKKWWFGNDFDDKNWELTDYPLAAGQGFSFYASSDFEDGLTVTLPSAL